MTMFFGQRAAVGTLRVGRIGGRYRQTGPAGTCSSQNLSKGEGEVQKTFPYMVFVIERAGSRAATKGKKRGIVWGWRKSASSGGLKDTGIPSTAIGADGGFERKQEGGAKKTRRKGSTRKTGAQGRKVSSIIGTENSPKFLSVGRHLLEDVGEDVLEKRGPRREEGGGKGRGKRSALLLTDQGCDNRARRRPIKEKVERNRVWEFISAIRHLAVFPFNFGRSFWERAD